MRNNSLSRKFIGLFILVSIVLYGVGKNLIIKGMSSIILKLLHFFDVSKVQVESLIFLKDSYLKEIWTDDKYGLILYYPSYYLLHIFFVLVLIKPTQVRKYLIIGITTIVIILILSRAIFIYLELPSLVYLARRLFHTLFGLPFILLSIEGGKILYKDIVKLSKSDMVDSVDKAQ